MRRPAGRRDAPIIHPNRAGIPAKKASKRPTESGCEVVEVVSLASVIRRTAAMAEYISQRNGEAEEQGCG